MIYSRMILFYFIVSCPSLFCVTPHRLIVGYDNKNQDMLMLWETVFFIQVLQITLGIYVITQGMSVELHYSLVDEGGRGEKNGILIEKQLLYCLIFLAHGWLLQLLVEVEHCLTLVQ